VAAFSRLSAGRVSREGAVAVAVAVVLRGEGVWSREVWPVTCGMARGARKSRTAWRGYGEAARANGLMDRRGADMVSVVAVATALVCKMNGCGSNINGLGSSRVQKCPRAAKTSACNVQCRHTAKATATATATAKYRCTPPSTPTPLHTTHR
jgi:hypothetical protein